MFTNITDALAEAERLAQHRFRAYALIQKDRFIQVVTYLGPKHNGTRKHMAIVWHTGCYGKLKEIRQRQS